MYKSLDTKAGIFTMCLFIIGCGPIPVETEPHQVPVKMRQETDSGYVDSARFRAVSDDAFVQAVLEEISKINDMALIITGQDFMAEVFPGKDSATLEELTLEKSADRIHELSLTHIILIEHRDTGSAAHGEMSAVVTAYQHRGIIQDRDA